MLGGQVVAAGHYSPLVRYQSPGVEFIRGEGEYMTRDWGPLLETPPNNRIRISPEQARTVTRTRARTETHGQGVATTGHIHTVVASTTERRREGGLVHTREAA